MSQSSGKPEKGIERGIEKGIGKGIENGIERGIDNGIDKETYGDCNPVYFYEKIKRIGEGTYGDVYCAVHKRDKTVVALKRILLHNEKQDGFPITSLREIAVLKKCKHQNIVNLLDVVVGKKRDGIFLVFEYCEHDLSSLMAAFKNPFTESEIKCLIMQLLSALEYVHQNYIVHRDIKLSNLLYNNQGQLKIADFGLARYFSDPPVPMTQTVVTLWYRSPELLLGEADYTIAVDIWAAGCVFGELLLGGPLMGGENELDQINKIFMLLGCPTTRIWPEIMRMPLIAAGKIDLRKEQEKYPFNNLNTVFPNLSKSGYKLFESMLAYDQSKRVTAKAALRHQYFYTSPYPKEQDFMPTYPSQHGESVASVAGKGRVRVHIREYERKEIEETGTVSEKERETEGEIRVGRGGGEEREKEGGRIERETRVAAERETRIERGIGKERGVLSKAIAMVKRDSIDKEDKLNAEFEVEEVNWGGQKEEGTKGEGARGEGGKDGEVVTVSGSEKVVSLKHTSSSSDDRNSSYSSSSSNNNNNSNSGSNSSSSSSSRLEGTVDKNRKRNYDTSTGF